MICYTLCFDKTTCCTNQNNLLHNIIKMTNQTSVLFSTTSHTVIVQKRHFRHAYYLLQHVICNICQIDLSYVILSKRFVIHVYHQNELSFTYVVTKRLVIYVSKTSCHTSHDGERQTQRLVVHCIY